MFSIASAACAAQSLMSAILPSLFKGHDPAKKKEACTAGNGRGVGVGCSSSGAGRT
jgi:hypothetical protein